MTGRSRAATVIPVNPWAEVSVPGWGWWGIDPTNTAPVGERHVKLGHGRDYDDVTPLRGVYYGQSEHHLAAEVTMSTARITREEVPSVELGQDLAQQQ
ncbi:MAG: transglutaminase family protein [Acidimicrobiia bacterium]